MIKFVSEIVHGPIHYSSGTSVTCRSPLGADGFPVEVRVQGPQPLVWFRLNVADGWTAFTPEMAEKLAASLTEAAAVLK